MMAQTKEICVGDCGGEETPHHVVSSKKGFDRILQLPYRERRKQCCFCGNRHTTVEIPAEWLRIKREAARAIRVKKDSMASRKQYKWDRKYMQRLREMAGAKSE
jgi:hypothetical protein